MVALFQLGIFNVHYSTVSLPCGADFAETPHAAALPCRRAAAQPWRRAAAQSAATKAIATQGEKR